MAQTPPPSITPAPTPAPQRGDRTTFSARVDAFVTWLTAAVAQFAAVATNVYNNAVDAYNNAVIATTQAAAAVSAVGAVAWASGTYVAGDVRYSPADGRTYRCWVGVTGSTDPSLDPAHWVAISAGPLPYIHVQDRKASGTAGDSGTSATWNTRTLNTIVGVSTIPGATLGGDQITLPAGTYEFRAAGVAWACNLHRISLYNATDSADIALGESVQAGTGVAGASQAMGRFTLSATKAISLRHYIQNGGASRFGSATSTGQSEVYANVQIWKVL